MAAGVAGGAAWEAGSGSPLALPPPRAVALGRFPCCDTHRVNCAVTEVASALGSLEGLLL